MAREVGVARTDPCMFNQTVFEHAKGTKGFRGKGNRGFNETKDEEGEGFRSGFMRRSRV